MQTVEDSPEESNTPFLTPEQRSELARRVANHDVNPTSALTRQEVEKRLALLRSRTPN